MYNDSDLDLTVENFYSNCKNNRSLYSAMRLDKVFNVTTLLNSSLVSIHMHCAVCTHSL
ncbi:unnamed protein product [Oncorhynchus mykiss]|uniref:Uncharacterized protein n=1 Tax=Oncorhynchus mykiss TaxID=8022 RepID=A0A060XPQ9_ONCMY|nr:unnamed protein product [Oncorhynchus mykiss]